jgi:hypothetical protein
MKTLSIIAILFVFVLFDQFQTIENTRDNLFILREPTPVCYGILRSSQRKAVDTYNPFDHPLFIIQRHTTIIEPHVTGQQPGY